MMCGNFGRDEGDCERCGRTVDSCSIKAKIKLLEDTLLYWRTKFEDATGVTEFIKLLESNGNKNDC